jgi:hypothetical protein
MLPIASSSGPAFIGVVVIAATLFLWWLLRSESRDEAAAKAAQEAEPETAQQVEPEVAQIAPQGTARKPDEDA